MAASKKTKIAIFGAGVGGLTVAHELSKFPDKYDITIYEAKNVIGGMARSSRDHDGCATEYCWRVFFGFYGNVFKIMSEIPIPQPEPECDKGIPNVLNNLALFKHLNLLDATGPSDPKGLGSWKERALYLYNIFYGLTSCDERLNDLDKLTWWEALGTTDSSSFFRSIGGWLGMDRFKGSYKSVIKVGIEMNLYSDKTDCTYADYITTIPTSEAWFNHWYTHLLSQGVKFRFGCSLEKVYVQDNNKIGKVKAAGFHIKADQYILAIPINVLAQLFPAEPSYKWLNDNCIHTQLSFQVYFNKQISLGPSMNGKYKAKSFLLVDSPWDIIVLSYDIAHCVPQCFGAGGWSVAACTAYVPGLLHKKPMNNCTYKEIIEELWYQMKTHKKLQKVIKKYNGFALEDNLIIKWSPMWPTYSNQNGKLYTTEPKFTNNAGSWAMRPSFKGPLQNMYISTAYAQEAIDIYSMEAACMVGKMTAYSITNGKTTEPYIRPRPLALSPMRALDKVAYSAGLDHWIIGTLVIILLIVVLKNNK